MKSGFSMIQNHNDNEEERLKQVVQLYYHLPNMLKNARICGALKRNCITKEDVRRCLMNKTFIYSDEKIICPVYKNDKKL